MKWNYYIIIILTIKHKRDHQLFPIIITTIWLNEQTTINTTADIIIIVIIINKCSIALFATERAQRSCSHTCTQYIPSTFTYISHTTIAQYNLINYTNIKQALAKRRIKGLS